MIEPSDYKFLCTFLLNSSGLLLGENKEYLLEARLIPLANSCDLDGIEDLVAVLKNGSNQHRAKPSLKQ